MLHTAAFVNSLAVLSGAFYLALYVLAVIWRDAFRFLFNAQFLGADVDPIGGSSEVEWVKMKEATR